MYIIVSELDLWFISGVCVVFIWRIAIWGSLILSLSHIQPRWPAGLHHGIHNNERQKYWDGDKLVLQKWFVRYGDLFQSRHTRMVWVRGWAAHTSPSEASAIFKKKQKNPNITLQQHCYQNLLKNFRLRGSIWYHSPPSPVLEFCWNLVHKKFYVHRGLSM